MAEEEKRGLEMTVDDLLSLKRDAEAEIVRGVRAFEARTGMQVSAIEHMINRDGSDHQVTLGVPLGAFSRRK